MQERLTEPNISSSTTVAGTREIFAKYEQERVEREREIKRECTT